MRIFSPALPKRFDYEHAQKLAEIEKLRPEYAYMNLIDDNRRTEEDRRLGRPTKAPFEDILNAKVARAMEGLKKTPSTTSRFPTPALAMSEFMPNLSKDAWAVLKKYVDAYESQSAVEKSSYNPRHEPKNNQQRYRNIKS